MNKENVDDMNESKEGNKIIPSYYYFYHEEIVPYDT